MCTRAPAITAVFSLGRLIAAEAIGSCQILCQENRKVVEQSIDADMATRTCTQGCSHEKQHFMGTFTQRGAWSAGREPEKKRIRALCKTTAQNKYTRFVIKKIKWSFNVALSSAQGQRLLLWLLWNKILIVMTLAVSFSALYKSECYRKKNILIATNSGQLEQRFHFSSIVKQTVLPFPLYSQPKNAALDVNSKSNVHINQQNIPVAAESAQLKRCPQLLDLVKRLFALEYTHPYCQWDRK